MLRQSFPALEIKPLGNQLNGAPAVAPIGALRLLVRRRFESTGEDIGRVDKCIVFARIRTQHPNDPKVVLRHHKTAATAEAKIDLNQDPAKGPNAFHAATRCLWNCDFVPNPLGNPPAAL